MPNRLATYGQAVYTISELGSLFHNANLGVASQVTDPYTQSALVFACVRVRAQAVASAPLVLYASTKDDAQTIDAGPLYDVFANPNPWMSWRRLAYMTQVFKDLDGAAYWIMYGRNGEYLKPGAIPFEIWPLRGKHCAPVDIDGEMLPSQYEVNIAGQSKKIPAAAVLPLLDMDPSAMRRGFGPAAAVGSEVETLFGLSQYDRKMSSRLGLPSVVMQTEMELTDDQLKAGQSRLEERLGSHNAGKPVLIGNGAKVVSIGQTAADMGHKDLREWEMSMILAAFGVTKPLIGVTDDVNRANADAAVQVFWRGTAVYLLRDLEDDIQTRFIRTRSGPERAYACGFDTSTVPAMQENATEMIANLKVLSDMGVSVPIGAKLLGWDVDEQLLDEIEAQAEAKKAADAAARAAAAAAFAGGSVADEDDEEDEQPQPPQQLARPSKEQREKQRAAILDEIAPLEARLAKKIAATQRDYVLALRKGLDKYAKLVARTPATTLATPEEALEAVLSLAPPLSEFTPQLAKDAKPILEAMFKKSAEALAAELGKSPLSITGPEAAILITKRVQLVEGTLTTLSAEVTDALAKALVDSAGFSSASLAEAVQGALETMRGEITYKLDNLPQRAGTIARTETASVQGAARHAEMVAQGVERHEWISGGDDATRDSHAELNGKVVKVGESFRDDITLRWVGDPAAPIGETIQCRCATAPVIED